MAAMVGGDGAWWSEGNQGGGGLLGTDSSVDHAKFCGNRRSCVCGKRCEPWSIRPGSGRHYRHGAGGNAAKE